MIIYQKRNGFTLTKDDFEITWYSGSGAGGSNRNKTQTCCRLSHPESGVTCLGTEERKREPNRKLAFERLSKHPKFRAWLDMKLREIESGRTIEEEVDEEMSKNVKYEIKVDGKWVEVREEEITDEDVLETKGAEYSDAMEFLDATNGMFG